MTTEHAPPGGEADGTPIGKGFWERLVDSYWIPFLIGWIVFSIFQRVLGTWPGTLAGGIPAIAVMLALWWARNRQRRTRLRLVALREGSFECCLRHPHALKDSLRYRWAYGACKLKDGTLLFQPLDGMNEHPMGHSLTFNDLVRLGQREIPAGERRGAHRSWQGVALGTDYGEIDLLVPPEAEVVLSALDDAG